MKFSIKQKLAKESHSTILELFCVLLCMFDCVVLNWLFVQSFVLIEIEFSKQYFSCAKRIYFKKKFVLRFHKDIIAKMTHYCAHYVIMWNYTLLPNLGGDYQFNVYLNLKLVQINLFEHFVKIWEFCDFLRLKQNNFRNWFYLNILD